MTSTLVNTTPQELYQPYLALDMRYKVGENNNITGKHRRRLTMIMVARFGVISPTIVMWLYGISKHQALEHLNKLEREGVLFMVSTYRSPDNRVYVMSYSGALFAQELLGMSIYYRSTANPALLFNANTVHHDLICIYCSLCGIQEKQGTNMPIGIVTELEFKRLFKSNDVRNVDGIIQEANGSLASIDVEHSYKNKQSREKILLKYLHGLKHGYYAKIFLFSQSTAIFDDIKRFHNQLFEELPNRLNKQTKQPILTNDDAELLKSSIIFRTKYCDAIMNLFYN